MIYCGGLHNIVLDNYGQLYSWGRNEVGQLGTKIININDNDSYCLIP